MKVVVVYERSKTGWAAYTPGLPGIGVLGKTLEEVRESARLAIAMHIEGLPEGELAERETPGDFAELVDVGPDIPEKAHWGILRRSGVIA